MGLMGSRWEFPNTGRSKGKGNQDFDFRAGSYVEGWDKYLYPFKSPTRFDHYTLREGNLLCMISTLLG